MILIDDRIRAALHQRHGAETTEEIIGVLTAISVVSKRMANKLALLELRSVEKEGVLPNGKAAISADAG